MAKRKIAKTNYVLSYILIVLLIVAVAGVIAYFTNGFTSEFKTFYVECDGKKILTENDGYLITPNNPLAVNVQYIFSSVGEKNTDYNVKVIPNKIPNKDFNIMVADKTQPYQSIEDLTAGFIVDKQQSSFTIKPKGNTNTVLKSIYNETLSGDYANCIYPNMYSLVISSYDGKSKVILNFSIPEGVCGLVLDKEVVVF